MPKISFEDVVSLVEAAAAYGTTCAYGAVNVKGAYTQMIASTGVAASSLLVLTSQQGGGYDNHLIDIATGAAAAETVVIGNLSVAGRGTYGGVGLIPIPIASGTRIAVRAQRSAGNNAAKVGILLIEADSPTSGSSENWGADTTASKGTVVDPGGTADTKGAWTQLIAASGLVADWVMVMVDKSTDSGGAQWAVDIGTGAAASETVVIPDLYVSADANVNLNPKWFAVPVPSIASGTRIAARAACSINTAGTRDLRVSCIAVARSEPAGGGGGGLRLAGRGGLASSA